MSRGILPASHPAKQVPRRPSVSARPWVISSPLVTDSGPALQLGPARPAGHNGCATPRMSKPSRTRVSLTVLMLRAERWVRRGCTSAGPVMDHGSVARQPKDQRADATTNS
jgi:hypothetical protein